MTRKRKVSYISTSSSSDNDTSSSAKSSTSDVSDHCSDISSADDSSFTETEDEDDRQAITAQPVTDVHRASKKTLKEENINKRLKFKKDPYFPKNKYKLTLAQLRFKRLHNRETRWARRKRQSFKNPQFHNISVQGGGDKGLGIFSYVDESGINAENTDFNYLFSKYFVGKTNRPFLFNKPLNYLSLQRKGGNVNSGEVITEENNEKEGDLSQLEIIKSHINVRPWVEIQSRSDRSGTSAQDLIDRINQIRNENLRRHIVVIAHDNGLVTGINKNATFIIALASSLSGSQTGHWIVFHRRPGGTTEVFDSYGQDIFQNKYFHLEIDPVYRVQMGKISQPKEGDQYQTTTTGVCGEYCLLYILCKVFLNKDFTNVFRLKSIRVNNDVVAPTETLKGNDDIVFAGMKFIFFDE